MHSGPLKEGGVKPSNISNGCPCYLQGSCLVRQNLNLHLVFPSSNFLVFSVLRHFVLRLLVLCLVCLQGLAPLVHAHVQGGAEHAGVHVHTGWHNPQTDTMLSSHAWSQDSMLAVEIESGLESRAWNLPHLPANHWFKFVATASDSLSVVTSAPRGQPDTRLFPPALAPPLLH